ncbi:hypothetical protein IKJ53_03350, partial [bacterium]|nr:hypothetical protein [bacterium]
SPVLAVGGAIYNNAIIEFVLGDFISNFSKSLNGSAMGGAIYNEKEVHNLSGIFLFNGVNGNSSRGGAIYNLGQLTFTNLEFIDNFAKANNGNAEGGIIYNSGVLNINDNLHVTGNYSYSSYGESKGGAIFNVGILSGDILGNFLENYSLSENNSSFGGAIFNNGYISNIYANFVRNSVSGKNAYGGAIYNSNSITNLKTNILNNSAESSVLSQGGAIFNKGSLYNISTIFNNNIAHSTKKAYGGAIYNIGDIHSLNVDGLTVFNQNSVSSLTDKSYGGAIYNLGTILEVSNIVFKDNIAKTEGLSSSGGAIYTEGYISKLNDSVFENNASLAQKGDTPVGLATGGALQNTGVINMITSSFLNNYAIGKSAQGGAIYNSGIIIELLTEFNDNYVISSNGDAQGGAIYNAGSFTTGIKDTSFYNNYAISTNGNAYGGAIYTNSDLMVQSTKDVLVFQGNYIQSGNNSKIYQAIYVGNSDATLTLSTLGESKMVFYDDIDGVTGFRAIMTGDVNAEMNLFNKISNAILYLENLTFIYNTDTFSGENLSLNTNSGNFEMRDSLTYEYFITSLFSDMAALYFIDVDPLAESIDKLVISNNASGVVTIEEINYVNKLTKDLILKVLETDSEDITISITHTVKDIVKELPNIVYNTDVFIQEEGASFHDKHTIKFLYHRRMDNLQLINEKIMVPNEEGLLDERFFIFKEDSNNDYKVLDTITTIGITTPGILNIQGCIVNDERSFLDFNNVEGFNLPNETILNVDHVKIVNSPFVFNLNNEVAQVNLNDVVLADNDVAIANYAGSIVLIDSIIEKDVLEIFNNNVINNGIMSISNTEINTTVFNSGVFTAEKETTNIVYNLSNEGVVNLFGTDMIFGEFMNTGEVNTSVSTIFDEDVLNYNVMNLYNHNQFEALLVNHSSATITTQDSSEEQEIIFNEINNFGTVILNADYNYFNGNVLNDYLMLINGKVFANALIDGVGLVSVNGELILSEDSEFTLKQQINIGDTGVVSILGGMLTLSTTKEETDADVINGRIYGESGRLDILNSSIFERQLLIANNSEFELNLTSTSYDSTMNGISSIQMGLLSADIDSNFKIDVNVETITNDNFVIHQSSFAILNIVQLNGLTKDNMPRKHTIEFFIINEDTGAILYLDDSPTGIIEQYKTVSKLQDFYQPDLDMYYVTSNDYIGERGIKLGETEKSIIAGDLTGYDELNILIELPEELTEGNPCTTRMFNVKENGYNAIKSAGVTASGVMTVYGDSEDNEIYFVNFGNKHSGFNVSAYPTNLTLRNITVKNALSTVDNGNGVGAGLTVDNFDSTILIDNVVFKENVSTFAGAAIYNNGVITEIRNTSFLDNYVYNDGSSTPGEGLPTKSCGGAIYSSTNLALLSDHHNTYIQGNYVLNTDSDKVYEAIYMANNTVLTLNSIQSGHFVIDDAINGDAYSLVLQGDNTSVIELNNKVINATVTSDNIKLKIAANSFDSTNSTLTINSGKLTTEDFLYQIYTIDDFTSVEGVEYFIDFKLFVDENDVLQYSTDTFKFTDSASGVLTLSDTVLSKLGLDSRYSKLSQYLFTHKDSYYLIDIIEKTPSMDITLSMTDMVVNYNVEYYEFVVKSSDFIGEIGYRLYGTTGFEIGVLSYIDSLIATNTYSNPDVKRTFVFESDYLLTEDSLGVTGEGAFDILGNT